MSRTSEIIRHATSSVAIITLAMLTIPVPSLPAQDHAPDQIESIVGERLLGPYHTNGRAVREAFREVVAGPRQATVGVLLANERVALGAIVDGDGWILTKASQIDRPGAIVCRLADGTKRPATVVGIVKTHDLAMLKIEQTGLRTIGWETGVTPDVGTWAVTPGSGSLPVSVGILSVAARRIPDDKTSGVLGVSLVPDDGPAKIERVMPRSSAEAAGMLEGDVIAEVSGVVIGSRISLIREIRRYAPGDRIVLKVIREGKQRQLSARLSHPFGVFLSRYAMQNQLGGKLSFRRDDFPEVFQHDGNLDPEDCGGPIVNLEGKAIGLNIARAGRTESYALPVNVILPLLADLQAGKFAPVDDVVVENGE